MRVYIPVWGTQNKCAVREQVWPTTLATHHHYWIHSRFKCPGVAAGWAVRATMAYREERLGSDPVHPYLHHLPRSNPSIIHQLYLIIHSRVSLTHLTQNIELIKFPGHNSSHNNNTKKQNSAGVNVSPLEFKPPERAGRPPGPPLSSHNQFIKLHIYFKLHTFLLFI